MAQFPMTESRRRILEKIPDYAVTIRPAGKTVTIIVDGRLIAESDNALLVSETRHSDVYYLPREDVDLSQLRRTDLSTYCPFKGHASYWSLPGNPGCENFVWSYEDPYPEVEGIRDYLSFYTDKVSLEVRHIAT